MVGDALVEAAWGGGYPEALPRTAPRRHTAWARQYLEALVQRDVRDVAGIDRLDPLPRLALIKVRSLFNGSKKILTVF